MYYLRTNMHFGSSLIRPYLWVLSSLLGGRFSRLLGFPDPLLLLVHSLLSVLPVLLPLVLSKLLGIGLHLLQPLVCLLIKVNLASSCQVCCSLKKTWSMGVKRAKVNLGEISKEPVRAPSELVSTGIVRVQLNCPKIVRDKKMLSSTFNFMLFLTWCNP